VAAGAIDLKKGSSRESFGLRIVPDTDKAPILKTYLESFKREVQRYFPVEAGAPVEAFSQVAPQYPVFELLPR
jgi:hypothetical protein